MLATGSSLVKTIQFLKEEESQGKYIVTAIACTVGIEYVKGRACRDDLVWRYR
jgi:uracil phosphoribosyltransferase